MTYWLEVSIATDGEGAEAVAEALKPYAYNSGVVLEQLGDENDPDPEALERATTVKIYVSEADDNEALRRRIDETIYHLGRLYPLPPAKYKQIEEEDWANAWKAHFQPYRAGRRLWIRPSWLDSNTPDESGRAAEPEDIIIVLDPGMAFGTGTHPTTQMCLSLLEQYVRPGSSLLDVGTGSAILSIAGAKLGSTRVLGIDPDDQAVRSAESNVAVNDVQQQVEIRQGTLDSVPDKPWDVVVVNILADVVRDLLINGDLLDHVADEGYLILAGILEQQAEEVKAAIADAGGNAVHELQVRDWVSFLVRHSPHL